MTNRSEQDKRQRHPQGQRKSQSDFNDPDRENSEQNEDGTQAQDVAQDALNPDLVDKTEPGHNAAIADVVPRDVPDLVSKQKEMLRSGKIDMDAFDGEEDMDDEAE
ncbi:hypothetical protein K5X80_14390 [Caenibius sp. WL]|nr:hypothetical protein K5X80_14390 [Caenibius sp. WL]